MNNTKTWLGTDRQTYKRTDTGRSIFARIAFILSVKYGLYSRYGRDENVTCRATVQPVYVSVSCRVERVWRQNKTVATKKDAGSGDDDGRWQSSSNLRQNER